jgi:hypothetical protein
VFETAERDEQQFFRKAEIDRITGYSSNEPLSSEPIDRNLPEELDLPEVPAQTFTKATTRVPEARQKFLDSVDKFIAGAREHFTKVEFNERQREIVNRLLNGFEGELTTSKWANLAKCSHDTALRDIEDLIRKKVLVKDAAGGRSTSYSLARIK